MLKTRVATSLKPKTFGLFKIGLYLAFPLGLDSRGNDSRFPDLEVSTLKLDRATRTTLAGWKFRPGIIDTSYVRILARSTGAPVLPEKKSLMHHLFIFSNG